MNTPTVSTEQPRIDRRLDQREDCLLGLNRWLEASRKCLGLGALALADADGCLVAGAGSARLCEELAAVAPLEPGNQNETGAIRAQLAAGTAWLCASEQAYDLEAWTRVQQGCLRILGLRKAA